MQRLLRVLQVTGSSSNIRVVGLVVVEEGVAAYPHQSH